jgi:hypothetical protein
MNFRAISNHPVWSGLIVAGVCSVAGTITGFIDWTEVWNVVVMGWRFLVGTSAVPNWFIAAVGLYIILTFIIFLRNLPVRESEVDWLSYRDDKFFGVRWRWRYIDYRVSSLNPFCPSCDLQLDPVRDSIFGAIDSVSLFCDCGAGPWRFEKSWDKLNHDVTKRIHLKVRGDTWQADRTDT